MFMAPKIATRNRPIHPKTLPEPQPDISKLDGYHFPGHRHPDRQRQIIGPPPTE